MPESRLVACLILAHRCLHWTHANGLHQIINLHCQADIIYFLRASCVLQVTCLCLCTICILKSECVSNDAKATRDKVHLAVCAGLAFAGVHDSFWTHAGSVEAMNTILREKFLELHSQPLLSNLRNELAGECPDLDIPEVPKLGNLQLDQITDAAYFFN